MYRTMAMRIHQRVVRGEIDNRELAHVRGRIWLIGVNKPILLDLTGNCWRDLAGCRMTFSNPQPTLPADENYQVAPAQIGTAGDITASRKVRVFDVPLDEALTILKKGGTPPEHMANSIYIEWFSEANGRVVIESADYAVQVSKPAWTLSPEDEKAQAESTKQAMLDWLDRLDEELQPDEPETYDPEADKPLDEFAYEKVMRESDVRTEKYMELL